MYSKISIFAKYEKSNPDELSINFLGEILIVTYDFDSLGCTYLIIPERSFLTDSTEPGITIRPGGPPPGFANLAATPPPAGLSQQQLLEQVRRNVSNRS
jgi:hypothetical protein